MPAMRRPAPMTRRPRLPKIMGTVLPGLVAELLGVEDPVVALDDDRVPAGPGLTRDRGGPLHDVAEAGVERAEVFRRVDEVLAGQVVLDPRALGEVIEDPTCVVVVDRDEAGDV